MRSRFASATSTSARIASRTPSLRPSAASRAKRWRSSATWSLRLRPVCSLSATFPILSLSRRSTAVCTSSSSSVHENTPASTSATTASRPRTSSADSSGVTIPRSPGIAACAMEPRTSYGASRTSKGMDALRRSKASAGDAENRPPQRGFFSLSFMIRQSNGRQRRGAGALTARPFPPLHRLGGRYAPGTADDRAAPLWPRLLAPPVFPYGGLEGAQAQSGVAGAAADDVAAQPLDEGPVVEVEDLVHREALVAHLLDGDGGSAYADGVALAGKGEALDPAVAVSLEVDDDRSATLRAATGHRDVRVFQNPLVSGVTGVLDEQRDTVLAFQKY